MSVKNALINLTRHSYIYTLSTFIQRMLGLIMTPIYTTYLAQNVYGDYSLLYAFMAFMNVVYLYGMDVAFMRFYFLGRFKKEDVYSSAFWAVSGGALLVSGLLVWLSPAFSQLIFSDDMYIWPLKLAAAILFMDTFSNLPYLILRVEERSVAYSVVRILRFLIELSLNIWFVVVQKEGFLGILYANVLASLLNVLMLLPIQWRYLKGRFRLPAFKEMALFGLPLIPNGLAYLLIEMSDKFLMNHFLGRETLGVYAANYKFGTILLFLVSAFRTAWQPFFLKVARQEDAKQIYARVLTYFTLIGVVMVVGVSYLLTDVLTFDVGGGFSLLGRRYWAGLPIIPVILTSYLFYGLYVNFTVGVYIRKRTRMMFLFTGAGALVNIASNFYLMPAHGMMGAAVATLLSYMVMAGLLFAYNQKIYPVPYDYKALGKLFLLLVAFLAAWFFFDLNLAGRLLTLIAFMGLLAVFGFLNRSLLTQLQNILRFRK